MNAFLTESKQSKWDGGHRNEKGGVCPLPMAGKLFHGIFRVENLPGYEQP